MKQSKLIPYLFLSVFFHLCALILLYQYHLIKEEKSEDLVPVEVIVIRDMPVVSISSPIVLPQPKTLPSRPEPIPLLDYRQTDIMADPIPLETPSTPLLNVALSLRRRAPSDKRQVANASNRMVTKITRTPSLKVLATFLSPEQFPEDVAAPQAISKAELSPIELKEAMALASFHEKPAAPRTTASISPSLRTFAEFRRKTWTGLTVPHGPYLLAPDDEPVALKLDRPPTIPFPGAPEGAVFLLVIDTSGSVKGRPLEGIKRSATEFISLMGPNDRIGLMSFNDTTQMISSIISQNEQLKPKINELSTAGTLTVLFDALLEASRVIKTEVRKNWHVVLFSDGKDEGSKAALKDAIHALGKLNISVLAVGFTRVEKEYLDILRRLADETGGIFVQTPELRDILALYKSVYQHGESLTTMPKTTPAFLLIESDPGGARLFIDGIYKGQTPMRVELALGKHDVILQNKGYYEWQAQVELSEAGEQPLFVRLLPIAAD